MIYILIDAYVVGNSNNVNNSRYITSILDIGASFFAMYSWEFAPQCVLLNQFVFNNDEARVIAVGVSDTMIKYYKTNNNLILTDDFIDDLKYTGNNHDREELDSDIFTF